MEFRYEVNLATENYYETYKLQTLKFVKTHRKIVKHEMY